MYKVWATQIVNGVERSGSTAYSCPGNTKSEAEQYFRKNHKDSSTMQWKIIKITDH